MKKRLLSFIVCFSLSISNTIIANATTNTDIDWNKKLIDGRNIAYMINSGVEYTVSIPNALNKLMYPSGLSNNLVLNITNNYMTSKLDFYQYSAVDRINASASVYRKNSSGNYYNSTSEKDIYDWVYGEIQINDNYMNNYNNTIREAILIHEMLHVYGLKDISNSNSIMYYATPKVTGVTSDANNVLNNKY